MYEVEIQNIVLLTGISLTRNWRIAKKLIISLRNKKINVI